MSGALIASPVRQRRESTGEERRGQWSPAYESWDVTGKRWFISSWQFPSPAFRRALHNFRPLESLFWGVKSTPATPIRFAAGRATRPAICTAQGSATVAMITAAGILSGIARAEDLGFHPVYLACAIGCGSKPIAWMNDSGFWVITRSSGMTEAEGLRYVTPMTGFMGLFGLLTVWAGVTLFPNL